MNTCLCVTEHLSGYKETPKEAGIAVADLWFDLRTKAIDLWSCDWFGQEFIYSFLARCLERGCLKEAALIEWYFPCETGNWGEPFYDQTKRWVRQFVRTPWQCIDRPIPESKEMTLQELADMSWNTDGRKVAN